MFRMGELSTFFGDHPMSNSRIAFASIGSVVALLVTTGIHHIFRLGIELTIPTLIATRTPRHIPRA